MTRRTSRLNAESLERRTMMAADMIGFGATVEVEVDEPASPEQEVRLGKNDYEISHVWLCGNTTSPVKKWLLQSQPVDSVFGGDTPIGTDLGIAGGNQGVFPGSGETPFGTDLGVPGGNQGVYPSADTQRTDVEIVGGNQGNFGAGARSALNPFSPI